MNIPLAILASAAVMGVLADILLKANLQSNTMAGLAVPVMTIALALATSLLACASKIASRRKGLAFLIPAVLFSLFFVLRDSPTLLAIDLGIIFTGLACTSFSLMGTPLGKGTLANYAAALVTFAITPLFNTIELLVRNINWNEMMSESKAKYLAAFLKGLAIATPLVGIFLGLFLAADPAFAAIAQQTFKIDFADLASNLVLGSATAWLAAGFLHGLSIFKIDQPNSPLIAPLHDGFEYDQLNSELISANSSATSSTSISATRFNAVIPDTVVENKQWLTLGLTEMATVLGSINLLFAGFVIVQLRYLFGGASLVELTPGLSYADYVHKGFFELNTVVALVLPLLLAADAMLTRKSKLGEYTFRLLAGTQIALVLVILSSAFVRMNLYQAAFGQSELRLYVTVFMSWLGSVCAIFAATVLSGNRQRFAFASYLSGVAIMLGVNIANPDAMVQASNMAQAKLRPQDIGLVLNEAPKNFDVNYAMTLSADGIGPLIAGLDDLPPEKAHDILQRLKEQQTTRNKSLETDWRLFNFGRKYAAEAIDKRLPPKKVMVSSKSDSDTK